MEVITFDSEAYNSLSDKLDMIASFVTSQMKKEHSVENEEDWVDSYEVCTCLRISERTLQRLRSKGAISYSIIAGKTYYTMEEIRRILKERLIRCNPENMDELVRQHKEYLDQRQKQKSKK